MRTMKKNFLRKLRERAGHTQPELAELLHISSHVTISGWENGRKTPTWGSIQAIGLLFGLDRVAVARGMGWKVVPGDTCSCCGGEYLEPVGPACGANSCRVELDCERCGKTRTFAKTAAHTMRCITCSNNRRRGTETATRVEFTCTGYQDFAKVVHAENCVRTRQFIPGQIHKYQGEGATIDETHHTYRCARCARAANVLAGSDRFLEDLYDRTREVKRRPRERKRRIQSRKERSELRRTLLKAGHLPGVVPHSRKGESHSAESRELIGIQNMITAWKRPDGARSVELTLCRLCGLLIMTEMDRLRAGKRGEYHRMCADERRRQVGMADGALLGVSGRLTPPSQRALGRAGRLKVSTELRQHFRWLVLRILGGYTYGEIASLLKEEGRAISRGDIERGINSLKLLLPPRHLASRRLLAYLDAFDAATGKQSDNSPSE